MNEPYTPILSEEDRQARRAQRAAARKRKQQAIRRRRMKQFLPVAAFVLLLAAVLLFLRSKGEAPPEKEIPPEPPSVSTPEADPAVFAPHATAATAALTDQVDSSYAVLIDRESGEILAEKAADTVISPASMTKVLTLLVAAEHVTDLDDTFTMTIEITDYCYVNKCSVVGLMVDETVSVRELLYGTILPSGADAAMGLAYYVSGSHEAFVDLMNDKLEELGISDTAHFTNCVGLYDENHFCTIRHMAVIMAAAMDNELCREVLNARTYETLPTADHPEGQVLSNWFLRRIEDDFTESFQIVGGKTGYVVEAGSCAVSCGRDAQGKLYLCATGDASSSWRAIYDHTALYQTYCGAPVPEEGGA